MISTNYNPETKEVTTSVDFLAHLKNINEICASLEAAAKLDDVIVVNELAKKLLSATVNLHAVSFFGEAILQIQTQLESADSDETIQ